MSSPSGHPNPQSEFHNPKSSTHPQPAGTAPQAPTTAPSSANPQPDAAQRGRGRPPVLDDVKRREICSLVAAGCSLQEAACYVGCSYSTVRRELMRNASFLAMLRQSERDAQLNPLKAIQLAAAKNWRAAAWILERIFPDHFARRNTAAISAAQARRLLADALRIIRSEVTDSYQQRQIEQRLRAIFDQTIHAGRDVRRTNRELRRAIKASEENTRFDDLHALARALPTNPPAHVGPPPKRPVPHVKHIPDYDPNIPPSATKNRC